MSVTLVLTGEINDRLRGLAQLEVETGGVLLARLVETETGDIRLLGTELHEVPEAAYERREPQQLLIRSDGYVPALARAAETSTIPIWMHTHPGQDSSPRSSKHDRLVDEQLTDLFQIRADSPYYGALVVADSEGAVRFTGHLQGERGRLVIDRLWVVGPRLALNLNDETTPAPLADAYDRNVRAFGGPIQQVLGALRVGLVGAGGTGSAVAEQLVRLGIRDLTIIDPDRLSASNVTRVYGSGWEKVGQPKVDVLGAHLRTITQDLVLQTFDGTITDESTAKQLLGMDLVFGCTDDNAGRLVLSRLASYTLTPVIDCGVLLSSNQRGQLDGIHGRVTVLYPGAACLVCRGRIDMARAASESLAEDERTRLVAEGYAQALPGVEPAVVAYTSMVGAMAVSELLERLAHYGEEPVPSEILLRLHDRELSTNMQAPRQRHYCDMTAGKVGLGLTSPFLEQTWHA